MVVREVLRADDAMHVRFHEFLDEVDFGKGIVALGLLDIENGNNLPSVRFVQGPYIFMIEITQKFHFT
jgi:hypothetical protein